MFHLLSHQYNRLHVFIFLCFHMLTFFTPGGNRETELMQALQQLLDRINSGNIPINPEMITRSGKEGATTIHRTSGQPV